MRAHSSPPIGLTFTTYELVAASLMLAFGRLGDLRGESADPATIVRAVQPPFVFAAACAPDRRRSCARCRTRR